MRKEMFKFDEADCTVCKAGFLKEHLDEQGRCKVCASQGLTPGTKQEQEFIKSPEKMREELKDLVREILDELKEEKEQEKKEKAFAPKKCKKCGEEFLPRAAAHVICDECSDAERDSRKS